MKKKYFFRVLFTCIFIAIGLRVNISDVFNRNNTIEAKSNESGTATNLRIPEISGLEGGYIPKNDIIIGGYKLTTLIINTTTNNKIDAIQFYITDKDQKKSAEFFKCKDYQLKSGKIILDATPTKIGDITFEGKFLPVKNGNYMDVAYDIIVLKGKLTIKIHGKTRYDNDKQEFTFFYGE
jgi:hypothetical protein